MTNSLTDVQGIRVGHYTDRENISGCTVVLAPPEGAVAGVDVRGPAAGTLGTETLGTGTLAERTHAVVLTGGSAFGLESVSGVMRFLEEQNIGLSVGTVRVPIVAGAVLFDLTIGNPRIRPDAAAGYKACLNANAAAFGEGSVGAGTGATVGKLLGMEFATKGGIGTASERIGAAESPIVVSALVVVNAVGDVIDPSHAQIIAGARKPDGSGWFDSGELIKSLATPVASSVENTTIGVIATDAELTTEQANVVAMMAHDGIARATRPSHTMFDGDTLFVLATGIAGRGSVSAIGHAAAEVVTQAILRGIRTAASLGGVRAIRDEKWP